MYKKFLVSLLFFFAFAYPCYSNRELECSADCLEISIKFDSKYSCPKFLYMHEMLGRRPSQEDRLDILKHGNFLFLAIYDGHGGNAVSTALAGAPEDADSPLPIIPDRAGARLLPVVRDVVLAHGFNDDKLTSAIIKHDRRHFQGSLYCGSTALLLISNLETGDSIAVSLGDSKLTAYNAFFKPIFETNEHSILCSAACKLAFNRRGFQQIFIKVAEDGITSYWDFNPTTLPQSPTENRYWSLFPVYHTPDCEIGRLAKHPGIILYEDPHRTREKPNFKLLKGEHTLGVSSAFGDYFFKTGEEAGVLYEVEGLPGNTLVSSRPRITHFDIYTSEYLLMACDGLTEADCLAERSPEGFIVEGRDEKIVAGERISKALHAHVNPAKDLCYLAHSKGSGDNITCMVVNVRDLRGLRHIIIKKNFDARATSGYASGTAPTGEMAGAGAGSGEPMPPLQMPPESTAEHRPAQIRTFYEFLSFYGNGTTQTFQFLKGAFVCSPIVARHPKCDDPGVYSMLCFTNKASYAELIRSNWSTFSEAKCEGRNLSSDEIKTLNTFHSHLAEEYEHNRLNEFIDEMNEKKLSFRVRPGQPIIFRLGELRYDVTSLLVDSLESWTGPEIARLPTPCGYNSSVARRSVGLFDAGVLASCPNPDFGTAEHTPAPAAGSGYGAPFPPRRDAAHATPASAASTRSSSEPLLSPIEKLRQLLASDPSLRCYEAHLNTEEDIDPEKNSDRFILCPTSIVETRITLSFRTATSEGKGILFIPDECASLLDDLELKTLCNKHGWLVWRYQTERSSGVTDDDILARHNLPWVDGFNWFILQSSKSIFYKDRARSLHPDKYEGSVNSRHFDTAKNPR